MSSTTTAAPLTTLPEESKILPLIDDVVDCAISNGDMPSMRTNESTENQIRIFVFIELRLSI
jgi:hypothetical protein